MRRRVQAALRSRGIEVRRTGAGPRRTLPEVLAHARGLGVAPRTVVDVGVAAGTPELYDAFPQARLLLVDPLREYEETLRALAAARAGAFVVAAAGAARGTTTFTAHRVPACSSVLGERVGDAGGELREVPVVTLDDVVREHDAAGPFVVKIDVEGGELDVIEGAGEVLRETALLLCEVSFFRLVPGGALVHEVVAAVAERGFVPYDVYNGHLRPLDGALAQLDLAFVPESSPLRADQRYATAEQADALYRRWGY